MKNKKSNTQKSFPQVISFRKLIGPSFVILALGLGSGEVILWPYLASNYGLGIAWGAFLGITFQFFINMEIERYALVKGESVFVGLGKRLPITIYWFILSTFIGFGIPGIIASSAKVFSHVLSIDDFRFVAIAMLIIIGCILSAGKTVYGLMEKITKTVLLIGVPLIFLLAIILSVSTDWLSLFVGYVGHGNGYQFFPSGMSFAAFLAAFAYSGAGGNLNLTQSIYVKEKGYGMGKYSQKLAGLFTAGGSDEKLKLEGETFPHTQENIRRYHAWWKQINKEHALVFWFIGLFSISLLMLLSYATTHGLESNIEGINFVIDEGRIIGEEISPIVGTLFLFVVSIMLFQTQLGIHDSTSRIMSENVAVKILTKNPSRRVHLSKIYYIFVWAQIVFSSLLFLFGFSEPRTLLVLGAVINAVAMFVHIGLVSWLNHKALDTPFQPSVFRKIVMGIIFVFFGFFSAFVLLDQFHFFS